MPLAPNWKRNIQLNISKLGDIFTNQIEILLFKLITTFFKQFYFNTLNAFFCCKLIINKFFYNQDFIQITLFLISKISYKFAGNRLQKRVYDPLLLSQLKRREADRKSLATEDGWKSVHININSKFSKSKTFLATNVKSYHGCIKYLFNIIKYFCRINKKYQFSCIA